MQKQSFKERERERREEEIIRAVANLIRERGFANVSMDDIADEVGVSKPTLYQHFKSKDDMIAVTVIRSMRQMHDYMDELDADSPLLKLEQMLRHMMETVDAPDALPSSLVEIQIAHPPNHPDFAIERDRVGNDLYALIEEGKARAEIAQDIPTGVIIGTMFSLLKVVDRPKALEAYGVDRSKIIDGAVHLFIRGIRPPQE